MRDVTEEVKDGVVRDYLRGDKTAVVQLEYKMCSRAMYRILRARKVKLRKAVAMRDVTEEVKDGVVRDYLRGDKTRVTQFKYKIRLGVMYRILRARKVKLRKVAPVRRDEVVKLRKGGLSYAEIGRRLHISRERVRQIVNPKPAPKKAVPQFVPKHPLFFKYNRGYLARVTGYSRGYLCRVDSGKEPLSRRLIERCCFKLGLPAVELFTVTGNALSVTGRIPPLLPDGEKKFISSGTR